MYKFKKIYQYIYKKKYFDIKNFTLIIIIGEIKLFKTPDSLQTLFTNPNGNPKLDLKNHFAIIIFCDIRIHSPPKPNIILPTIIEKIE